MSDISDSDKCSVCGEYFRGEFCENCASGWDPTRLAPQVLAALVVVHDLVASATEDRRAALERARDRAMDLALEVGRALMSSALVDEHSGYQVVEIGRALSQELGRLRARELAAIKGGERIALRAALMNHGTHVPGCPRVADRTQRCTCGWAEIAGALGVVS